MTPSTGSDLPSDVRISPPAERMMPAPVMDGTPAQATQTSSHDPSRFTAASAARTDSRPPDPTISPSSRRRPAAVPLVPPLADSTSAYVLPIFESGSASPGSGATQSAARVGSGF